MTASLNRERFFASVRQSLFGRKLQQSQADGMSRLLSTWALHTILTDNGIPFRFPPRYANGPTARFITHMFAMRCRENGIEQRFTKINYSWTNGQVERTNRTIKDATVRRYHYDSHAQLERHLGDFAAA